MYHNGDLSGRITCLTRKSKRTLPPSLFKKIFFPLHPFYYWQNNKITKYF